MTANPSQNMPTQPPRAFLLRAVFHFGASIDVCFVSHLCHRRYSGVADFVRIEVLRCDTRRLLVAR